MTIQQAKERIAVLRDLTSEEKFWLYDDEWLDMWEEELEDLEAFVNETPTTKNEADEC